MEDACTDLRKFKLPFVLDEVEDQCHDCVRKQLKKYEKFVDEHGKAARGKFLVPCTGIPRNQLDPNMRTAFTDEAWAELEAVADIVKWAARYLKLPTDDPWIARWYQGRILRCTSRRKVLRTARRTGKTDLICIEICYYLFTEPNIKIVVAGPQKSHTEEIITRVRAFIHSNPELANMVVRDVSAPYYEIKLTNGARLRGFAAGTKGKSEGVSIRGQDADRLYLEEMDYIDEKAITGAVIPLLQTSPDTALVGFSTPSGFQTPYYKFCTGNPHYKEYHHNYKVLPHWKNVEMERSSFTEEDWTHEYLAEWGSSEAGVYKPEYIDTALTDYQYGEHKRSSTWRYCIGTDWNEQHGTEIVVVGHNTFTGKFQIVDAVLVPKTEFTQLTGVQKLLEMNRKWRPSFVYIDAGGGSTNYELLRQTAYKERRKGGDLQTAKLLDILKKYDSGASLQVRDPITHEKIKKPAKPFMVSASVRAFEQERIIISSHDHVLEKQLRNYIVERVTPTKVQVFGLREPKVLDHRLDALNLALVAFHLEFDDLHASKFITTVIAVPDPRTVQRPESLQDRENRIADQQQARPEIHRPEDRRMEEIPANSRQSYMMPGRISSAADVAKTNRVGWESDMEAQRKAEWLQRKRRRANVHKQRPSRTNI
jgi:replicative DNA helicase